MNRFVLIAMLTCVLIAACGENLTPEQRLAKAREHIDAGDGRAALIQLKNALQEKPDFIEARVLHGRLQLLAGDAAAAEKEFAKAREAGDDSPETRLLLLQSLLDQGKPEEVLREAPAVEEADADTLAVVARAQFRLGHPEKARTTLQIAARNNPDSSDVQLALAQLEYGQGNNDQARSYLDKALALDPGSVPALLFAGDFGLLTGEHQQALEKYNQALAAAPQSPRAMLGVARACIYLRDTDCAEKPLKSLRGIIPKHPETRLIEAYSAFLRGDNQAAVDAARAALSVYPQHAASQLLLSQLLLLDGAYDQASELVDAFLKQYPDSEVALKRRAAIRLRQADPDAVIETIETLPDEARDSEALMMLASAYGTKGDAQRKRETLDEAISLAPDDANLQVQMALERFADGQTEAALAELEALAEGSEGITNADVSLLLIAVRNGEVERALTVVEDIAAAAPESGAPANIRGVIHMGQDRREDARAAFEEAHRKEPAYKPALYNLASLGMVIDDNKMVDEALGKLLELDPRDLQANMLRASQRIRQGDLEAAIKVLADTVNAHPEAVAPRVVLGATYLRLGDIANADVSTDQALKMAQQDNRVRLLRAQVLLATGNLAQAINLLESIVKQEPGNHVAVRLLAESLYARGDKQRARSLVTRTLESTPDDYLLQYTLARFDLDAGELDAARNQALVLQDALPGSAMVVSLLGDIAGAGGRWGQATTYYRNAFDLNADTGTAIKLHHALIRSGNGTAATTLVDDWLAENPDDVTALLLQASQSERNGQVQEAIDSYQRLLEAQPNNVVALNNLAWLLRDKDAKRALDLAGTAYAVAPDNIEVADTYGWLLVGSGQAQQGLRIIRQAADAAPDKPGIRYHLAVAMAESGQRAEAEVELRRLLRDHPDFPEREQAQAYYDGL